MRVAIRTDSVVDGTLAMVVGIVMLGGLATRIPSLQTTADFLKLGGFSLLALVIIGWGFYRLRLGLNRAIIEIVGDRFRVTHSVRVREPWQNCDVALSNVSHLTQRRHEVTTGRGEKKVIFEVYVTMRDGVHVLLARSKSDAKIEHTATLVADGLGVDVQRPTR
ncbi:MAG: hypothetical protein KC503_23975 [Myxococcales bacterium]|nr:hypothetical protein [Myxococcales bacterium]